MAWEARFIDFRRQKEARPPSLRKTAEQKTDYRTQRLPMPRPPLTMASGTLYIDNTKTSTLQSRDSQK